ncbi:MAG: glycosyltransferase family 2 protein [Pyrinomonadaceae bacterium]|nr:glycosyltransferase family 2 protein [Sphingobacteriaceae bacterium]
MATYNGEKYLKVQLDSILSQLKVTDEVIISDDQSSDDTLEIIKSYKDSRIRLLTDKKFASPIYNFENAIMNASGDIIFLSDQDDLWLPSKVSDMLEALNHSDIVVSNCYMGDEQLNIIKESYFAWRDSKKGFVKNIIRNSYLGCCIAFKRKLLHRLLPFPKHIPMHDMWIGLISEIYYKPVFLQKQLMIYRRHGGNVTTMSADFISTSTLFNKFKFRLNLLASLLGRVLRII